MLAPTIGRALRAAFDREQATEAAGRVGPEVAGVLVLGPDRRVRLQTPAAAEWLGLLRDTRQPAAPGAVHLPTAVWAALARLGVGPEWGLERGVLASTPAGPLRVEAAPAGEDGSVAVVLTPQRPPAPVDLPAAWPLTGRERDVLALLARGLSNRHVAAALGVSENTVEAHLVHAYEKLGVHSRGELLARLFREAYWPAFRAPGGADRAT
jgi:DNA-binding CsgD family transcriptional regulator